MRRRPLEALRDSFAGTLEAIRTPSFWPVFLLQLTGYSSFVLVVGLWGGPYLTHVYGYSLTERGNMLLVAVVAQVIGVVSLGAERPGVQQLQDPGSDRKFARLRA